MLFLTYDERAVNYWGPRIDHSILFLTQATNAPIARRVPYRPPLTTVPIEWVPLGDLSVPPALSEIVDTPAYSPVDDSMVIMPRPPAGAPPSPPVSADSVPEEPFAPQMIGVRPKTPRFPPVVVSQPSGASVSLRVPPGHRSVPMPAVYPSGAVIHEMRSNFMSTYHPVSSSLCHQQHLWLLRQFSARPSRVRLVRMSHFLNCSALNAIDWSHWLSLVGFLST